MACLARSLVACLPVVVVLAAVGCLPSRGSAMGLPQPPPDLNFTIAVEGVVLCKTCRYAGYVRSMDASPLPSTFCFHLIFFRGFMIRPSSGICLPATSPVLPMRKSILYNADATALLRCRRAGDPPALSVSNTTDAGGYFLIQADWQSAPFKSKDCKVYVQRSPAAGCAVPVKPAAKKGVPLKFRRFVPLPDELQARYTAGNITFAPEQPAKC